MSVIVGELLDDLWPLLAEASELAGAFESGDPAFTASLRSWLGRAEQVLEKHHQAQVSELAGLRAQLGAGASGVFDVRFIRLPAARGARKTYRAVAALLLHQAQGTLGAVYESFIAKREEAGKYVRQILVLALQKQVFYPAWTGGADRADSISRVWQTLMADTDAQAAARHVVSLLSYPDALRLVDQVTTEWQL